MSTQTVRQVLAGLGRRIPWSRAAGWDASGLQLGDPDALVGRIGVCHEVTEEVVARVEADPVDLLITYHPLLFRPTTTITAGRSPGGRALRMIRHGVAVAVAHTAFDVAPGGTADSLALALGLEEVGGFGPVEPGPMAKVVTFAPAISVDTVAAAMTAAGAGRIGNYSGCSFRSEGTGTFHPEAGAAPVAGNVGVFNKEPEVRVEMVVPAPAVDGVVAALVSAHPYEEPAYDVYEVSANMGFVGRVGLLHAPIPLRELAPRIEAALAAPASRVSGDPARMMGRVAVVPGSGSSMVSAAVSVGADVLVTGDLSHHQTVEALDRGLAVVDPGHAATERPGIKALVDLAALGPIPISDLTGIDPTPWH